MSSCRRTGREKTCRNSLRAPEITINAAASAGGIYNRSVPVSVSVEDILSGGTFSGLKSVTAEVVSAGKVTQRYERSFGPKEERRKTYAEDFTVDAAKNNSNNVMVRITAQDYAGNVSGMEEAAPWMRSGREASPGRHSYRSR